MVVNAAQTVVEQDFDGSAIPDCLEAILRKQANERDLALNDERHSTTCLQCTIADRQRDKRHTTVGGKDIVVCDNSQSAFSTSASICAILVLTPSIFNPSRAWRPVATPGYVGSALRWLPNLHSRDAARAATSSKFVATVDVTKQHTLTTYIQLHFYLRSLRQAR
jgi:hypothetical protein